VSFELLPGLLILHVNFAAEIYYFKPVRSGINMINIIPHIVAAANSSSIIDVPWCHLICCGFLHGDLYSSPRTPPLFEPCELGCPRLLYYA
jgi:hypothetical protein